MEDVALWVLEPIAHPGDPIWQDRRIWSKVVVSARSAAFARLAAENWAQSENTGGPGNESASRIAGFRDERIYSVRTARRDEVAVAALEDNRVVSAAE